MDMHARRACICASRKPVETAKPYHNTSHSPRAPSSSFALKSRQGRDTVQYSTVLYIYASQIRETRRAASASWVRAPQGLDRIPPSATTPVSSRCRSPGPSQLVPSSSGASCSRSPIRFVNFTAVVILWRSGWPRNLPALAHVERPARPGAQCEEGDGMSEALPGRIPDKSLHTRGSAWRIRVGACLTGIYRIYDTVSSRLPICTIPSVPRMKVDMEAPSADTPRRKSPFRMEAPPNLCLLSIVFNLHSTRHTKSS